MGEGIPNGKPQPAGRTQRGPWVWSLALVVTLAICAGLWGGSNWLVWKRVGRQAFPMVSGELQVKGLTDRSQLERDSRGIPHIAAGSESDAWASLGFAHAQDRLAQMLWLRRMARGRTAEVAGEAGLAADRLARTVGIGRLADAEMSRVSDEVRRLLEAYSAGVNARMERIRQRSVGPPRALPPQDSVLEAWTPSDSLAVSKLLAWAASPEPQTQVVLEALLEKLGTVGARPFFPTGAGVRGISLPFAIPVAGSKAHPGTGLRPSEDARVDLGSVALRATAWALPPELTVGGAPLLGVDFQLSPTSPSLLYEAHLQGGSLEVGGLTVPGLPVFWAGRNKDVAWAATPARVVTADLYREKVRPPAEGDDGAGEYLQNRRWHPLGRREEVIRVASARGGVREEMLEVIATGHGPLFEAASWSASTPGERDPLAIRWTGFEPGNGIVGLLEVAHANSAEQVREALAKHHEPVISVLYADRAGEVAVQMAGWLPRKMLPTGVLPVTGHKLGFDWRARLAYSSLPARSTKPAKTRKRRGREAPPARWLLASDEVDRSSFGAGRIEWLWHSEEDAARVEAALDELTGGGPVELWQAAAMQRELRSGVSKAVRDSVLELAGDPEQLGSEARELRTILAAWDGQLRGDSRGGTVYAVFLDHLVKRLFEGPVGWRLLQRYLDLDHVRPGAIAQAALLAASLRESSGGWAARARVEEAVRSSLKRTSRTLSFRFGADRERWVWGERYPIDFTPLVRRAAVASRAQPLSALAFSGRDELAVSSPQSGFVQFRPGRLFEVRSVTSARLLMDLSDDARLLSVLAPGQSEHPGHPHFADGIESWRLGEPRSVTLSPFLVGEANVERLLLRPRR